MRTTTLLLLAILLSSCYTQNKALKQVSKAHSTYPGAVAILVDQLYPYNKTSDSTIVEYRTGETRYLPGDTITIDCDSVLRETKKNPSLLSGSKVNYVKVPCPPSYSRVDTSLITRNIERESTRRLAAKEAELTRERADNAKLMDNVARKDKKIRTLTSVCIWGGIIALVLLALMWFLKR